MQLYSLAIRKSRNEIDKINILKIISLRSEYDYVKKLLEEKKNFIINSCGKKLKAKE